MTGYTVHTGSTEKFAAGWDVIFKRAKRAKSAGPKKRTSAEKSRAQMTRTKGRKAKRGRKNRV